MKKIPSYLASLLAVVSFFMSAYGTCEAQSYACDDCHPRIAVKNNMLYDLALTPNIGAELSIAKKYSLSLDGVYAWWSNDSAHRYWRIRGASIELRYWIGEKSESRALTGHRIGIYGSCHDYDFEFGGRGWQSPDMTYSTGISYGYAIRLNRRMNLDFGLKAGYSCGRLIKYRPECDGYVCTGRYTKHYFGLTGLEVSLVWFPGSGKKNRPDFGI